MNSLWRHVVGCSHQGVSRRRLGGEEPAEPEVAELDDALGCDEDVGRLDISVHDSLGVHVLQGRAQLDEVFPNRSLRDQALLFLEMFDHP